MTGKSRLRNCSWISVRKLAPIVSTVTVPKRLTDRQACTSSETTTKSPPSVCAHAFDRLLLFLLGQNLLLELLLIVLGLYRTVSVPERGIGGRCSGLRSLVQDGDELGGRGWKRRAVRSDGEAGLGKAKMRPTSRRKDKLLLDDDLLPQRGSKEDTEEGDGETPRHEGSKAQ